MGSIIPYITQPTKVFFVAQLDSAQFPAFIHFLSLCLVGQHRFDVVQNVVEVVVFKCFTSKYPV